MIWDSNEAEFHEIWDRKKAKSQEPEFSVIWDPKEAELYVIWDPQ